MVLFTIKDDGARPVEYIWEIAEIPKADVTIFSSFISKSKDKPTMILVHPVYSYHLMLSYVQIQRVAELWPEVVEFDGRNTILNSKILKGFYQKNYNIYRE